MLQVYKNLVDAARENDMDEVRRFIEMRVDVMAENEVHPCAAIQPNGLFLPRYH